MLQVALLPLQKAPVRTSTKTLKTSPVSLWLIGLLLLPFKLVTALFTVIMLRHNTMVGDALEKYNLKELMLDLFLC